MGLGLETTPHLSAKIPPCHLLSVPNLEPKKKKKLTSLTQYNFTLHHTTQIFDSSKMKAFIEKNLKWFKLELSLNGT